ncbi:hypothetical protein HAX54_034456 [Datura stramonium]|uniref:Uncharacterized protein n=1 Tax=Datura stramonium TaxID=4076 RepID=A0ABS8SE85_DATST|nr:hypothetical protein [Datura stramonium]
MAMRAKHDASVIGLLLKRIFSIRQYFRDLGGYLVERKQGVSDLCLGKPALRPIPATATVAEALSLLKRSGETHVSGNGCNHSSISRKVLEISADTDDSIDECRCVGKISMVDVICFLCKQRVLIDSSKALEVPIWKILPKGDSIVRHLEHNSSLLEAIDYMLEGIQNLVIPIHNYTSTNSRRKQQEIILSEIHIIMELNTVG